MTVASFAFTYVLGGLTFIPLLLALVLIPAWYLLPRINNGDDDVVGGKPDHGDGKQVKSTAEGGVGIEDEQYTRQGASGTFAVLRSYQFQAALTALNAKTGNAANTNGASDGTVTPESTGGSVYQSMYRSVFDRNKNANSAHALLESEEASLASSAKVKKKAVGSVFYIVLRHGHLMLYDSPAQIEVRHVISLAHHSIDLSDGEEGALIDADLFIKRTAIVLTPIQLPDGRLHTQSTRPRPFYLFTTLCSEKEDFYQALLTTRAVPPIPQAIVAEDAIKLQSILHSTSLTPETRAFNALIGRIFLAVYRTPLAETFIRSKIEKKITRVQKPTFIAALTVKSIDLGDAAPVLSNPRLRDLNISGDMTLAFDMRYNGGFKVVISALAKLDLGARFKARTVDLVLATSLQRMQGHLLVRVKAPPSNRIWFCFESMPEMDIKVEPVVSQRQITYNFILRAIEERIRGVVGETLVRPNWDDVPFFNTMDQRVRGGIWSNEGRESGQESESKDHPVESQAGDLLSSKNDKTMSMPVLSPAGGAETPAASSGSEHISGAAMLSKEQANELKRRSVASLPPGAATKAASAAAAPDLPRPLRSPSFTSPLPAATSVSLDGANIVPMRADDATLQPMKGWRGRSAQPPVSRKDAAESMREMRDRVATRDSDAFSTHSSAPTSLAEDDDYLDDLSETADTFSLADHTDPQSRHSRTLSEIPASSIRSGRLSQGVKGTDTASMSSTASPARSSPQQRKNLLAATAAATTAARNWSWNAIANRTKGGSPHVRNNSHDAAMSSTSPQSAGQPIGRGQPLPPPGQPLPGPAKVGGLWGAGNVKRKSVPALPPRPRAGVGSNDQRQTSDGSGKNVEAAESSSAAVRSSPEHLAQDAGDGIEIEDEFGPWRENSGTEFEQQDDDAPLGLDEAASTSTSTSISTSTSTSFTKSDERLAPSILDLEQQHPKIPPPLPARRRHQRVPSQPILLDSEVRAWGESEAKMKVEEDPSLRIDHRYARPGGQAEVVAGEKPMSEGGGEDEGGGSGESKLEQEVQRKGKESVPGRQGEGSSTGVFGEGVSAARANEAGGDVVEVAEAEKANDEFAAAAESQDVVAVEEKRTDSR